MADMEDRTEAMASPVHTDEKATEEAHIVENKTEIVESGPVAAPIAGGGGGAPSSGSHGSVDTFGRAVSTPHDLPRTFSSVQAVSCAEEMNPRYRSTMEDTFVVVDGFGRDANTFFAACYDGHGGRFTAEFLRTHLHENVERELHAKGKRSVEECLKAAFLMTDIEVSKAGEPASGSTAVLCIIRRTGVKRYVYTANCGDARAVLSHDGRAVRLSMDHKATDPDEVARIEAAGGFVARKRVVGTLAVARAFGDLAYKKFVTAEPYTSTTKVNSASEFIILACDGVWDVLTDDEACDIVRNHVDVHRKPRKTAAATLVRQALARGSSDNVTCIVVFL